MTICKTILQSIKSKNEKNASLMLMMILGADIIFILFHIIHQRNVPILRSPLFNMGMDLGYAEFYQYLKFYWIILLLTYILISTKCFNYISWILIFIYFLLDDSMQIHEKLGGLIADSFHFLPPFNLRLQDLGELIVSAGAGILFLSILLWTYLRGSHIFKKISIDMLLFIAVLAFLGIGIDIMHEALNKNWVVEQILGLLEDGGEMIVVSLILWYVFIVASRKGNFDLFLHELLSKSLIKRHTD